MYCNPRREQRRRTDAASGLPPSRKQSARMVRSLPDCRGKHRIFLWVFDNAAICNGENVGLPVQYCSYWLLKGGNSKVGTPQQHQFQESEIPPPLSPKSRLPRIPALGQDAKHYCRPCHELCSSRIGNCPRKRAGGKLGHQGQKQARQRHYPHAHLHAYFHQSQQIVDVSVLCVALDDLTLALWIHSTRSPAFSIFTILVSVWYFGQTPTPDGPLSRV